MPEYNEPVVVHEADDRVGMHAYAIGTGVAGESSTWMGVYGKTDSTSGGAGVMGEGAAGGPGVIGKSATWHGVYGETSGSGPAGAAAVVGENKSNGAGVVGIGKGGAAGVVGLGGPGPGVLAKSNSPVAARVEGILELTGYLDGQRTLVGRQSVIDSWSGEFFGDVKVHGHVHQDGHDYAETFATEEGAEPGTVLVISENGLLTPCSDEYDTSATGVVSGAGGLSPGSVLEGEANGQHPVTVALAGQVYVKADATYGAISVGDLLTTSSHHGFAMRVEDRSRAVGAIIGKALAPLPSGTGLVRMLVVSS
ncbi:hypothetical protein [Streptomyces cellostaticus]|uniref:hypothetical protein n=1 Tax=Streptomyces cellostaticus TaxID=67285 RepID=UPI000B2B5E34|nr:hypothetical protein [Streptomyces cellostaticus]GHI07760.1 hypothetical protein Scel_60810 [Streptomyces cellostaticus]